MISETFSFDDYIESLKYDTSKNAYNGVVFQSGKNKVSLNFYLSKDKKMVKAFEICEFAGGGSSQTGSIVVDSKAYCSASNIGQTDFEKPDETTWVKNNVYNSQEIIYSEETGKYIFHSAQNFYSNLRIERQLDQFDANKPTYLKINSGNSQTMYKHADDVLYLGNKKLVKDQDWSVQLDSTDNLYYIKINQINNTDILYCVSNPTAVIQNNGILANEGVDVITIYQ